MPRDAARENWLKTINQIAALKPDVVVPGHEGPGATRTMAAVDFMKQYIADWDANVKRSKDAIEMRAKACTVLVDGTPVRSCMTPVQSVAGKRITTIEGVAEHGRLHPIQQAFLDAGAFQCGYCTSGMIVAAVALFRKNAKPSAAEIRQALNGNICRCGTYPRIVEAVRKAAGVKPEASGGE